MGNAYKWIVMLTVSISNLMTALDISIVFVSFPRLAELFHTDASVVGWVTIVYSMSNLGFMLTLARIGDSIGRKKVYIFGLSIYTIGMLLCSLSQSMPQLIISRIIQGSGASTAFSLGPAIVVSAFPVSQRGRALGILGMVQGAGLVGGPALGGLILDMLGWQAIFYSRVPLGVIGVILAFIIIREKKGHDAALRLDLGGAITLLGGTVFLLLYLNLGDDMGYVSAESLMLAAAALALFILFVIVERRMDPPLLDLGLFKNPVFSIANIISVLSVIAMMPIPMLLPFYLFECLLMPAPKVGLIMVFLALPTTFIGPFSGWLSDRIGTRIPQVMANAVLIMSLIAFCRLGVYSGFYPLIFTCLMFGSGMGLLTPANNSAIAGSVPQKELATGMGVATTLKLLTGTGSLAVSSALFAGRQLYYKAYLAEQGISPEMISRLAVEEGFDLVLKVSLCFAILAFVMSFFCGSWKSRQTSFMENA